MVKEKSPKSQTGSGTGTGNKDEWNGVDTPGKFLNPDVIFRPKYDLTVPFCVKLNFRLHKTALRPFVSVITDADAVCKWTITNKTY